MRILHTSDTHGTFSPNNNMFDIVVHSGDFCPNTPAYKADRKLEAQNQMDWLKKNLFKIKAFLQDKPLIFILGNHDFLDANKMERLLRSEGVIAYSIENKVFEFNDKKFYGFPYIPFINGIWNYEKRFPEMKRETDAMVKNINSIGGVDVLVCHSPPYQTLDKTYYGQNVGSTALANVIDYELEKLPKYYLTGHIHENNGIDIRNNIIISNAGTTQHILEI